MLKFYKRNPQEELKPICEQYRLCRQIALMPSVMECDLSTWILPIGGTSRPSWLLTCEEIHFFSQRMESSLSVHIDSGVGVVGHHTIHPKIQLYFPTSTQLK
jgi:hypothetical protein